MEMMKRGNGYSGSKDEMELTRRQMNWAEQVDLAYPLEECWSECCLTDPHECMGDHHAPRNMPAEAKPDNVVLLDQAQDSWDTECRCECCLLESMEDHHVPNKEQAEAKIELTRRQMNWAEQVDLAYPLEECWSERCLTDPHECMGDHHAPRNMPAEAKPEDIVLLDQAEDSLDTECRCECCLLESMDDHHVPDKEPAEVKRSADRVFLDQVEDQWNTFDYGWLDTVGPGWFKEAEADITPLEQIEILSNLLHTGCESTLFTRSVDRRERVEGSYCYVYSAVPAVF